MNTSEDRRVCSKCLKKRPADWFKNSSQCKRCRRPYFRAYNKKRYASPQARQKELRRSREKYWRIVRNQRMERKRKLILLMGGKCQRCSYRRSAAALDFHHCKKKARLVSQLLAVNQPWAWEKAIREAKKCELLCANCHREETHPGHEIEEASTQCRKSSTKTSNSARPRWR
jgi:hypothetical protein